MAPTSSSAITAVCPPAPARAPAPADDAPTDGASFADLLGRSREAEAARARADEAPGEDDAPGARAHGAGRAGRGAAAHRGERAAPAEPAKSDATTTETDPAKPDDPAATPADPALPPWLAALHVPAPRADTAPSDGAPAAGAAAPATTPAPAAAPALPGAAAAHPTAARDAPGDAAALPFRQALAAAAGREAGPEPAGTAAVERPAAPSVVDAASAPLPTATAAPPLRPAEPVPSTPPQAALAAPVDSPDFSAALGVQVSVFAREGVHEAQLQLNPADMGPVSVQIALDGTQARVHFGAEVAATRQAIEASLPELAAALRDAGFTLSGGGVSQQRGGRSGEPAGDASGGVRRSRTLGGGTGDSGITPLAPPRRVTLGGLDLYA